MEEFFSVAAAFVLLLACFFTVILYFKIWIATNDIAIMKNQLSHMKHVRNEVNHIIDYMLVKDGMTIAKHPTEANKMIFVKVTQDMETNPEE